jgi:Dyp-type peroxidase family
MHAKNLQPCTAFLYGRRRARVLQASRSADVRAARVLEDLHMPQKTNVPPVTKATSVAVAPTEGLEKAAKLAAHCQPCPPTIRLDAPLRWKAANSKEQKLLRNLQGNILKGHGRDHTWNVFFTFGSSARASRRLLRQLGNGFVTDAYKQLLATEAFKATGADGGMFCAVFLSAKGYQALGLTFTAPAENTAFGAGMKAAQGALGDPPSAAWEAPFQQDFDGMVLIGDSDVARGSAATASIQLLIADAGGTVHHTQVGTAIRNTVGNGLEHFGYIDGRSQPLMLLEDVEQESRDEGIAQWDPTFPLSTALVPDPLVTNADELAFGSFFVFRKLEQNVRGFKMREQELADALGLTGEDRERAGAFVVGRFEDGTPITMDDEPAALRTPHNDFDYTGDAAASRCPFHAHIRKTNPRGSGGFEPEAIERLHIMARRGIPYEDVPRPLHPDGLPEAESLAEFLATVAPNLPAGGVGLLFMAYNARIDQQFAFTQSTWANNAGFPNAPAAPGLDGLIGQDAGNPGGQAYPDTWDEGPAATAFNFKGFVTMKGGEYFFAPSLHFLRNL